MVILSIIAVITGQTNPMRAFVGVATYLTSMLVWWILCYVAKRIVQSIWRKRSIGD